MERPFRFSFLEFGPWINVETREHPDNQRYKCVWRAFFFFHSQTHLPTVSPAWDGQGKPPSEMIMTDGCGFANATLLSKLQEKFEWDNFPTVVQVRIGGAKVLQILSWLASPLSNLIFCRDYSFSTQTAGTVMTTRKSLRPSQSAPLKLKSNIPQRKLQIQQCLP